LGKDQRKIINAYVKYKSEKKAMKLIKKMKNEGSFFDSYKPLTEEKRDSKKHKKENKKEKKLEEYKQQKKKPPKTN